MNLWDDDPNEALADARLRQSYGVNPEQAARLDALSRRGGLPLPVVQSQADLLEAQARADKDRAALAAAPKTRAFIAGGETNAALVSDQVPQAAATERNWSAVREAAKSMDWAPGYGLGMYEAYKAGGLLSRLMGGAADVYEGFATAQVRNTRALAAGVPQLTSGLWGAVEAMVENSAVLKLGDMATGKPLRDELAAFARRQRVVGQEMSDSLFPTTGNFVVDNLRQGLRSVPASVGAGALTVATRNPTLGAAAMAGVTAGSEYGRARDEGVAPNRAMAFGLGQGAFEGLTELLPATVLLKGLTEGTGALKAVAKSLIAEVPGEQLATVTQDLNDWVTLNPEKTLGEFMRERPEAMAATFLATLTGTAATVGATHLTYNALRDIAEGDVRAEEAQVAAKVFDAMVKDTSGMALRERSPALFQELMEAVTDGVSVHVNAKAFASFLQSLPPEDAQTILDGTGVEPQVRAATPEADIVIPAAAYLTFVGAENHSALSKDIKLGPAGMSINEAEAHKGDREQLLADAAARVLTEGTATAQAQDPVDRVREHFYQQARAVGVPEAQARANAALQALYYGQRAERDTRFVDAWAAYEEANVSMRSGARTSEGPRTGGDDIFALFEQRAWHGTPHIFDKFSLHAMGTGEGNQAYGWGMYFAGRKAIAEFYRHQLTGGPTEDFASNLNKPTDEEYTQQLERYRSDSNRAFAAVVLERAVLELSRLSTRTGRDYTTPEKVAQEIEGGTEFYSGLWYGSAYVNDTNGTLRDLAHNTLRLLAEDVREGRITFSVEFNNPGRLYEVEVPEDDELLDFEASLKQQSPQVTEALAPLIADMAKDGFTLPENATAAALRMQARQWLQNRQAREIEARGDDENVTAATLFKARHSTNWEEALSRTFLSYGIPGLRYRDSSSRRDTENPTYNYVIWQEDRVDITGFEQRDPPDALALTEKVPGLKGVLPYLTQDERTRLKTTSARNLVKIISQLPKADEMAAVAFSGRAKRGWYEKSAEAILNVFGAQDAPRFAALLAALSPQTSVESNLYNALSIWVGWERAGRPTERGAIIEVMGAYVQGDKGVGSVLDAWINNSVRALSSTDPGGINLSGPKVNSFLNNLIGVVDEVTNDAWMANYALVSQNLFRGREVKGGDEVGFFSDKSTGYVAMSAVVRRAAAILSSRTGQPWTPAEVQETVWSWAKTLYEMRDSAGDTSTEQLLRAGGLTHDDISATPDFAVLFTAGVYRRILEAGGYGPELARLIESGRADGLVGGEGDVFSGEGSGFSEAAFQRHLLRAARRIERRRAQARDRDDKEFDQSAQEDEGLITLSHWSDKKKLKAIDPKKHGNNYEVLSDIEKANLGEAPPRSYWGVGTGQEGEYTPEYGIGPYRYEAKVPRDRLYDLAKDPDGLLEKARAAAREETGEEDLTGLEDVETLILENMIRDAGWLGYMTPGGETHSGPVAALFEKVPHTYMGQSFAQDIEPGVALEGLPRRIKVDGETRTFGPHQPARDAAAAYMRDAGVPYDPPRTYAKVDEDRARRIAQAFEDMAHAPGDPEVRAAYDAMIAETLAQWEAIKATGLEVEFNPPGQDPYGNPRNAILDVVENNHLWVFPTDEGFGAPMVNIGLAVNDGTTVTPAEAIAALERQGVRVVEFEVHQSNTEPTLVARLSGPLTAKQANTVSVDLKQEAIVHLASGKGALHGPNAAAWGDYNPDFFLMLDGKTASAAEAENPLLQIVPGETISGRPVTANDIFRIVHDYFGHIKEGVGFRAEGEENAWRIHSAMYSPLARKAMTTETRGQNSWVNFGPHAEHNKTASGGDTVYAEQKIGLLPDWVVEEGATDAKPEGTALNQGAKGPRGRVTFTERGSLIDLFRSANASTLIHEGAGHIWLENLARDAMSGTSSEEVTQDFERIKTWWRGNLAQAARESKLPEAELLAAIDGFGLTDVDINAIRPFHEMFARAAERYVMEGKSPREELRDVFVKFREWLVAIYKDFTRLNVPMTDEVRGVFDRLIGGTQAVQAAAQRQGFTPFFADPTTAGMTPEEYAAYLETLKRADAAAEDRLLAKLLSDIRRRYTQAWKIERSALVAEFQEQIDDQPLFRALTLLETGAARLQRDAVFDLLPTGETEGSLYRRQRPYVFDTGVHPDDVAEQVGLPNGQALIDGLLELGGEHAALRAEGDRRTVRLARAEALADAEMLARHGDILNDGRIGDEALAALHDIRRSEVLMAEVRALVRKAGATTVLWTEEEMQAWAKRQIGALTTGEIRPHIYVAAEAKAGRDALKALVKDDFQGALDAKFRQLLNTHLYRVAKDARARIDKGDALFEQIAKAKNGTLSKSRNMDMVGAARQIIAAYGYSAARNDANYMAKVAEYDPELWEDLRDAITTALAFAQPTKGIEVLTLDQFESLYEIVDQLWRMSRTSRQMEIDFQDLELEDIANDLSTALGAVAPRPNTHAPTATEHALRIASGFRAALRRVESWVSGVDGGGKGPWRTYVWQPISEAATRFRLAKADYLERFVALLTPVQASLKRGKIAAPELGYTFGYANSGVGKAELLHALLHTGNDSNKRKLLLGRGWAVEKPDGALDTTAWDKFVDRMHAEGVVTEADWQFVQGVWDLLEEMKPAAQRAHRQVFGRYFEEVTANPVVTPFGVLRGGYVPAITDTFLVQEQALNAQADAIENSNDASMFPSPNRGFTKSRVDYNKPLLLDLGLLPSHIDKVLKFSHMAAPVRDVLRLLKEKGLSTKLEAFDAAAVPDMLLPWLNRAAKQIVEVPSKGNAGRGFDAFFRAVRHRTGMGIMIANVSNTLQQFTGWFPAALRVRKRSLVRALWQVTRDPAGMADAITTMSPYMATRTTATVQEASGRIDALLLDPSKYQKVAEFSQRHAYIMQSITQNLVDMVTWSAAFEEGLERGEDLDEAVRSADSVIRETQSSLAPEDVSRFEVGPPVLRIFTQFYSYFSTQSNLWVTEFGNSKTLTRSAYIYILGIAAPAIISEIIRRSLGGGWDDEDDDGYLDMFLDVFFGSQFRYVTAALPIAGQIVASMANQFNDQPFDDKVVPAPAISTAEQIAKLPEDIWLATTEGKRQKAVVRETATLLTLLTGIPLFNIAARPLGYLADVNEGKVQPTDPLDFGRGLVTGSASAESRVQ